MSTWHPMTVKPARTGIYVVEDGWEDRPLYATFVTAAGLWGTPRSTLRELAERPPGDAPPTVPCDYERWRDLTSFEADLLASLITVPEPEGDALRSHALALTAPAPGLLRRWWRRGNRRVGIACTRRNPGARRRDAHPADEPEDVGRDHG
jgi:hypothetical protein